MIDIIERKDSIDLAPFQRKPIPWQAMPKELVEYFRDRFAQWRNNYYIDGDGYGVGDKAIRKSLELLYELGDIATLFSCEGHYLKSEPDGDDGEMSVTNDRRVDMSRNKTWFGFYVCCLVTERGERLMKSILENIQNHPITVKHDGIWQQLRPDTLVLEYDQVPPFALLDGDFTMVPCLIFRVRGTWPLKVKQRFIANFERAVKEVLEIEKANAI